MADVKEAEVETVDVVMEQIRQQTLDLVPALEKTLGAPAGLVREILDDPSDWSFIVKMQAFIEAALTQVIAGRFESAQLQKHLSRLPIEGRTGKLQLALDLSVVTKAGVTRMRTISAIRNAFVHDVKVIQMSLGNYIDRLEYDERSRLGTALMSLEGVDGSAKITDLSEANARMYVGVSSCLVLGELYRAYRVGASAKRWESARGVLGDALLAQISGKDSIKLQKMKEARALLAASDEAKDESPTEGR